MPTAVLTGGSRRRCLRGRGPRDEQRQHPWGSPQPALDNLDADRFAEVLAVNLVALLAVYQAVSRDKLAGQFPLPDPGVLGAHVLEVVVHGLAPTE